MCSLFLHSRGLDMCVLEPGLFHTQHSEGQGLAQSHTADFYQPGSGNYFRFSPVPPTPQIKHHHHLLLGTNACDSASVSSLQVPEQPVGP